MQNYTEIPSSQTLSASLVNILNNDKTALSCSSGTVFPTTNLQVGMLCFRTDQTKLYELVSTGPDTWRLIMDVSSGIDTQLAAKLNAASYTAADVLAKLTTVDGSGSGVDADLLDGQHASAFATSGHNHDATYLGTTAKAADSDTLDGYHASSFVRSVNGSGPDASGNTTVNVDLSSRVAKNGDTMSGNLTVPSIYASNWFRSTGASGWYSESYGGGMWMQDSTWVRVYGGKSFLTDWHQFHGGGNIWTSSYGWLHDRFAAASHGVHLTGIHGGYNGFSPQYHVYVRNVDSYGRVTNAVANCNCDCYCFPKGTQVQMLDGTLKSIEDVALGEELQSGFGGSASVAGLHKVTLGSRRAYRINGVLVTTGDHLFKTTDGWASLEPELYAALRFGADSVVTTTRGEQTISASAIDPSRVTAVTVDTKLLSPAGEVVVESVEIEALSPDTPLYSFFTVGASTFVAQGFVVDGAPQEDV